MEASTPSLPGPLAPPLRRRHLLVAGAVAAIAVLLQGAAEQLVDRGSVTLTFLLRWRLYPLALWMGAAPLVVEAGRRWPVGRDERPAHLAVHALLFSGWMLLSNLLLRVPDAGAESPAAIGAEAVAAAIDYAPAGALVWIGLVAAARVVDRRARERTDRAPATPLSLRVGHRTYVVPRPSVRWVEADGDYLRVHAEDRTYRVRGPMKDFARELADDRFLRIHRSTLVNLHHVREVQPYLHGDYVAILRDGTELRVPRSRRAAIRRLRDGT